MWLPQPGGPGPRIYIPQEQGDPVIPPGTGFPFVASYDSQGLRWKYSNPPPHGFRAAENILAVLWQRMLLSNLLNVLISFTILIS
jgi:hypothetical protein